MSDKPNVLLFLTDDHAGWAMGCAGLEVLRTAAMDSLARRGIRFSRAVTPTPVCSPGRASLWTGTTPSWHGVHDHLNNRGHPGIGDQPTLATAVRKQGYRTAQIGKWHCHTSENNRRRPEFDRWFSHSRGTRARFTEVWFRDQDREVPVHGHQATYITEQTVGFLRNAVADNAPFFCAVGYVDTHSPLQDAPERLADIYRSADLDAIPDEVLPECHGRSLYKPLRRETPDGREKIAQYLATAHFIDEQVGRLLDELDNLGRRENTLVLYTADHGHCTGNHGIGYKGNCTQPQNFFDENLNVPLVAHLPGRIEGGVVSDAVVTHMDTSRTLLELTGATMPDDAPRPGRSWLPLVGGDDSGWDNTLIAEYGNARMIRADKIKLIRRWPGENGRFPDELYDLERDPRETVNRIDDPEYRNLLPELDSRMEVYFEKYGRPEYDGRTVAERPSHNPKEPWRVPVDADYASLKD